MSVQLAISAMIQLRSIRIHSSITISVLLAIIAQLVLREPTTIHAHQELTTPTKVPSIYKNAFLLHLATTLPIMEPLTQLTLLSVMLVTTVSLDLTEPILMVQHPPPTTATQSFTKILEVSAQLETTVLLVLLRRFRALQAICVMVQESLIPLQLNAQLDTTALAELRHLPDKTVPKDITALLGPLNQFLAQLEPTLTLTIYKQ